MNVKWKYVLVDEANSKVTVVFYTDAIQVAYEASMPARVAREMLSQPSLTAVQAEEFVRKTWPMGYFLSFDVPPDVSSEAQFAALLDARVPVTALEKMELIAQGPRDLSAIKSRLGAERVVPLPVVLETTTVMPVTRLS